MIAIYIHVTNPFHFLIIKLYKVILYLCFTHKHPHTLFFTQITVKEKVMHTINIRHTYKVLPKIIPMF